MEKSMGPSLLPSINIPKLGNFMSIDSYRLISLYNCTYKIIKKYIPRRSMFILSSVISKERFGFLKCRHIHNAIGLAQEVLHSIKKMKMPSYVSKLDLSKEYDRVDCTF
jgi:hypothetical protein